MKAVDYISLSPEAQGGHSDLGRARSRSPLLGAERRSAEDWRTEGPQLGEASRTE